MNAAAHTERNANRQVRRHCIEWLATCALAATVFGCSGSGSNGDADTVSIGSGQGSDPVVIDFPVFYVKRPVPDPMARRMPEDARELLPFETGADLFMRERASPTAAEVNLTAAQTQNLGDVRDVNISPDGKKVVFAMRGPRRPNVDEDMQPTWKIWEYDIPTKVLRRLIASNTIAEEGHDRMPSYLPDGRIVFTSTRQRQSRAILLDESKPQFAALDEDNNEPAFVLHVMNADGSNIHQISFNQSHDRDPTVLPNGQIAYSRWDNALGKSQYDLYKLNPDGSGVELLYGANSHNTGTNNTVVQFLRPRAMADGRTLAVVRPFTGTEEGGDLVIIDTNTYVENRQPTLANAGMQGPAQVRALPVEVLTIPGPSSGGRFRSAAPLFDGSNRLLVSWSQCRLMEGTRIVPCTADRLADPNAVEAPPIYGVYIYNVSSSTQQPIVSPQEGVIYTEVTAASSRTLPPVILDGVPGATLDSDLVSAAAGVLHIRSVYDIDGRDTAPGGIAGVRNPAVTTPAQRPARFLRVEKVVSTPDDDIVDLDNAAFGPNRGLGMRDILGYAPIEPDGSVKVRIPANVAFSISVLDANGRRVGALHQSWLQVRPGEVLECNGCHTTNTDPVRSHGRNGLFQPVNTGATANGQAFANTDAAFANPNATETMAQLRNRVSCADAACPLSVNLLFADVWPSSSIARAASFGWCYTLSGVATGCTDNLNTPSPTTAACEGTWAAGCRVSIHYKDHIHPLWLLARGTAGQNTCTNCHSPSNAASQAQVPAGQLDLTDGPSDEVAEQLKAYRELLFGDTRQILNATGMLEDECAQLDPVTQVCVAFATTTGPMSVGAGARGSRFFRPFDNGGGTVDHRGLLTPAELKLLAEWLDIGAQNFNNPFHPDAPRN